MAAEDARSARRFLASLPGLDVVGRRILVVHSQPEDLCRLLADTGARDVVGVNPLDLAVTLEPAPYDLVISRGSLVAATDADAHIARLRAALAAEGTVVIEFPVRRPLAPRATRDGLTLEAFADVMARSCLHCTWYRVQRAAALTPSLRKSVLSLWRQPLYGG